MKHRSELLKIRCCIKPKATARRMYERECGSVPWVKMLECIFADRPAASLPQSPSDSYSNSVVCCFNMLKNFNQNTLT
jgi:hypothetical protein